QAEEFCRRSGNELHESVGREFSAVNAPGINQAKAVLDTRAAVWNFREIIFPQFLLSLHEEREVVCRNNLQCVLRQALPQFFLIPLFSQWRSEYVFRALETRHIHIFERQMKVLRARFGVGGQAAIARLAYFLECV